MAIRFPPNDVMLEHYISAPRPTLDGLPLWRFSLAVAFSCISRVSLTPFRDDGLRGLVAEDELTNWMKFQ